MPLTTNRQLRCSESIHSGVSSLSAVVEPKQWLTFSAVTCSYTYKLFEGGGIAVGWWGIGPTLGKPLVLSGISTRQGVVPKTCIGDQKR